MDCMRELLRCCRDQPYRPCSVTLFWVREIYWRVLSKIVIISDFYLGNIVLKCGEWIRGHKIRDLDTRYEAVVVNQVKNLWWPKLEKRKIGKRRDTQRWDRWDWRCMIGVGRWGRGVQGDTQFLVWKVVCTVQKRLSLRRTDSCPLPLQKSLSIRLMPFLLYSLLSPDPSCRSCLLLLFSRHAFYSHFPVFSLLTFESIPHIPHILKHFFP